MASLDMVNTDMYNLKVAYGYKQLGKLITNATYKKFGCYVQLIQVVELCRQAHLFAY